MFSFVTFRSMNRPESFETDDAFYLPELNTKLTKCASNGNEAGKNSFSRQFLLSFFFKYEFLEDKNSTTIE